jgi:hypothetical protein
MENEIKKPSVEWLFVEMLIAENKMQKLSHDEKIDLLEKAKERHKNEMVIFALNVMMNYQHGDVLADVATKLYTETYEGGNK